jgi:hypothetical protein
MKNFIISTGDKQYNREWEIRGNNYFVNGM